MVKLILKVPISKAPAVHPATLAYIATRERVEVVPDDRPSTRKQEQLIAKLTKDFRIPKRSTSTRTIAKPTKVNASAFITLALESNWDSVIQSSST